MHDSLTVQLGTGLSYVRSHVWLWGTFATAASAYLMFHGPILLFIVKEQMRRSAAVLGLVFAVGGLGSITAAVLLGSAGLPLRSITFIYVAWSRSMLTLAGCVAYPSRWPGPWPRWSAGGRRSSARV